MDALTKQKIERHFKCECGGVTRSWIDVGRTSTGVIDTEVACTFCGDLAVYRHADDRPGQYLEGSRGVAKRVKKAWRQMMEERAERQGRLSGSRR